VQSRQSLREEKEGSQLSQQGAGSRGAEQATTSQVRFECLNTYMHTHIHTHTDTYTQTYRQTCTHTDEYTHTCTHTHTHTHTPTHTHTHRHIDRHVHTHWSDIYTHIHTHIHTRPNARMQAAVRSTDPALKQESMAVLGQVLLPSLRSTTASLASISDSTVQQLSQAVGAQLSQLEKMVGIVKT